MLKNKIIVNMSYCQLVSTFEALEEFYDSMQEEKELSPAEQKYKARLIELCYQVIELHENLNS